MGFILDESVTAGFGLVQMGVVDVDGDHSVRQLGHGILDLLGGSVFGHPRNPQLSVIHRRNHANELSRPDLEVVHLIDGLFGLLALGEPDEQISAIGTGEVHHEAKLVDFSALQSENYSVRTLRRKKIQSYSFKDGDQFPLIHVPWDFANKDFSSFARGRSRPVGGRSAIDSLAIPLHNAVPGSIHQFHQLGFVQLGG